MKELMTVLEYSPLFHNITPEDIGNILPCLNAYTKDYKKNEFILHMGDLLSQIGIVIDGELQIMKEDADGNRIILTKIKKNQIFAESIVCAQLMESPINAIASSDCKILWIQFSKIITTCPSSCEFHHEIIRNLLKIIAEKNLHLNSKINILSKKTIREKILAYLYTFVEQQHKKEFKIPFDRNELADYLSIDRSALSRELSKMQAEGILSYHKNYFSLYKL